MAAGRFRVSLDMVKKLLQQHRRLGEIGPQHHRTGRKPRILPVHREQSRWPVGRQTGPAPGRTADGHWRTTTMISSVRLDGRNACMTIDGTTYTAVFQAYVREILGPSLRPDDIVIMDNLGPHKNEQTRALIAAAMAGLGPRCRRLVCRLRRWYCLTCSKQRAGR